MCSGSNGLGRESNRARFHFAAYVRVRYMVLPASQQGPPVNLLLTALQAGARHPPGYDPEGGRRSGSFVAECDQI